MTPPQPSSPLSTVSLKQNLEAQLSAHQQVNTLLQQLRQSALVGKTEGVQAANSQLETLSKTMVRLEQERQQLLNKAGYTTMPLRQLMQHMPASEQQSLNALRDKLNHTIRQVRLEQESTQSVLATSIQWINQTVQTIAQKMQPDPATQNYKRPVVKASRQSAEASSSNDEIPTATPPSATQLPPQASLPKATSYTQAGLPTENSIIERTA